VEEQLKVLSGSSLRHHMPILMFMYDLYSYLYHFFYLSVFLGNNTLEM
jgi:hypothetical protein